MPGAPADLSLDVNGHTFRVLDTGTGPGVLLLHGVGGTGDSWQAQVPALVAAGFRTLAPDLRGLLPGTEAERNIGETIDDIRSMLRILGVPRVHVVGQDRGAEVAWMLASTLSKRIDRVVVIGSGYPDADRFPPVTNSVLAIWGDRDTTVPEAVVKAAASHVAGPWRFEQVAGAGAAVLSEDPAALNALLLDFLAEAAHSPRPATALRAMVGKPFGGVLADRIKSAAADAEPGA